MAILLRQPDKKIKLTKEQLQYFIAFLEVARIQSFSGHNYFHHAKEREELYQFSLATLAEKMVNKLWNNSHQLLSKKLIIPVNFAEEKTLFACVFRRIDCTAYVLSVQQNMIAQLKPLM